jgi:subfamily B ATP-binding cassette protein MsbA
VTFNVLYALFSSLSMLSLLPMLNIMFGKQEKVLTKPVLHSLADLGGYLKDSLAYYVTKYSAKDPVMALLLFRWSFRCFPQESVQLFRNGAHHRFAQWRTQGFAQHLVQKIIELPISFYSEKRKGDVMARMLGDVGEVQTSFFSIFELVIREPLTILFTIVTMFFIM